MCSSAWYTDIIVTDTAMTNTMDTIQIVFGFFIFDIHTTYHRETPYKTPFCLPSHKIRVRRSKLEIVMLGQKDEESWCYRHISRHPKGLIIFLAPIPDPFERISWQSLERRLSGPVPLRAVQMVHVRDSFTPLNYIPSSQNYSPVFVRPNRLL